MLWGVSPNVEPFLDATGAFLRAAPVDNTVLLTETAYLAGRPTSAPDQRYGWWPASGPTVRGAFLQAPRHPPILSRMPLAALPSLVDVLAGEPALGVGRCMLAFLSDGYAEELDEKGEKRVVLRLHPAIAPIKVAVLPLSRNEKLTPTARQVHETLRKRWMTQYDDAQSIGRRYRRQDEIGTALCVTIDFKTVEEDQAVTIRERDSMAQVRVPIAGLEEALRERLPDVIG